MKRNPVLRGIFSNLLCTIQLLIAYWYLHNSHYIQYKQQSFPASSQDFVILHKLFNWLKTTHIANRIYHLTYLPKLFLICRNIVLICHSSFIFICSSIHPYFHQFPHVQNIYNALLRTYIKPVHPNSSSSACVVALLMLLFYSTAKWLFRITARHSFFCHCFPT